VAYYVYIKGNNMRYAETGYNLEIDLTRGNIERVATDPKDTELYLGGLGTSAKIMWDRVPPEIEAFSPDNLLIFAAGLLCGTPATGCNRTIVSTISPQTKLMVFSMMGGFWAPELKYAGYDKVILRGKSPDLVYLWINNDKVEIRDASHLKGKGANETAQLLCKELQEPKAQVAAIGLAGENRVFFASIEQGRSSASRGGIGAVMGDKGVKAIVVRGTNDIHVAQPVEYLEQCNEVIEYIKLAIHDEKWHTENFSWGNSRTRRKDFWNDDIAAEWRKTLDDARTRMISCYNCPLKCGATLNMPGLPTYMMKCFTKLTYTMAAMSNLEFGLTIAQKATEYGVDGYSAPQVMAFALELYEDGILTDKDLEGMPPESEERFFWLLDKIVRREGIGDVLANGTHWAAKEIGNGAEAYAHNNIKKLEQLPLKLGMLNPIYFLMYCTGEKINKFKQYFLDWEPRGENSMPYYPTVEMTCDIVDWMEKMHYIDDALGMCAGLSSFHLKAPYHIHNFPKFISAGTGIEMDEDKLTQAAKRYRTLVRAINIRRGMRRKDEKPPEDHWKKRIPELEKELLDTYYAYKGWNNDGIPTQASLEELGLDYVSEDFLKRGILTDGE